MPGFIYGRTTTFAVAQSSCLKNRFLIIFPVILTALCFTLVTGTYAQQAATDTTLKSPADSGRVIVSHQAAPVAVADTVAARVQPFQPNPKRSGLYSAILPGLGQLYNRQYWKVPVIYAGLGIATYFIVDNYNNYESYRKAYIGRINNPYPTDKYVGLYTTDQLQQLQNDYNKYLDMTVLFTGLGYALQVIEAMTGAHLKNFDVSRDISMHFQPVAYPNAIGLGLVVNLK